MRKSPSRRAWLPPPNRNRLESGEQSRDAIPRFGQCDPHVKYEDRQAAYAVILHENTFAAVKSARGRYFLPGGGTMEGETAEQTVLREIREELACDAKLVYCLGEAEQLFFAAPDNKHFRMRAVFFVAELFCPNETAGGTGEETLMWLSVKEAREKMFHACHAWAVNNAATPA